MDCDGVLADFDKAAEKVFGMPARQWEDKCAESHFLALGCTGFRGTLEEAEEISKEVANKEFWEHLVTAPDFFYNMDPMPDAYELWRTVEHLNPIIITGCPDGGWAEVQKHRWVRKHFGRRVSMITCASRDKSIFCEPGDIIVDDWPRHQPKWEAKGGIWVHHESAEKSIQQLRKLGIVVGYVHEKIERIRNAGL